MRNLTYQEKMLALSVICEPKLQMRPDMSWYVSTKIDRKEGCILSGGLVSASTPEEAINVYWDWATDSRYYIVTDRNGVRAAFSWKSFMWVSVDERVRA